MPKPSRQIQAELLYAQALFKTVEAENMGTPSRIPTLIECSVCHKLINEPNIDVCDNCWDKHQCEEYDHE